MNPQTISLAELQKYLDQTRKEKGWGKNSATKVFLLFAEEVGELAKAIHMMATGANGLALEVGHLSPGMIPDPSLGTGEIGYIVTNLKTTREARVGDTVTLKKYFTKVTK